MLEGFRNLFSSGPVPYADPKSSIPLSAVLRHDWMDLWYQPKVELRTTHLVGAEALVRARHPTRGIIPPGLFLPGASEQAGGVGLGLSLVRQIATAHGGMVSYVTPEQAGSCFRVRLPR